ncbi:MAG: hypothetical protein LC789_01975 [Actinobacteria bacterium]|nr:hypothetical protein [Actinomycetota bacterium]MCA1720198.1 hypothetical protein [Actinomycetota bacterium]
MHAALQAAALLCSLLGLLCAALAAACVRDLRLALGVLLDYLLAAGLLRLAGSPGLKAIAGAALIVAVRKLATFGLAQRGAAMRPLAAGNGDHQGSSR